MLTVIKPQMQSPFPHATMNHRATPQKHRIDSPDSKAKAITPEFGLYFATCAPNTKAKTAIAMSAGADVPYIGLKAFQVYMAWIVSTNTERPTPTAKEAPATALPERRTKTAQTPKMSDPSVTRIAGMKSALMGTGCDS